MKKLTLKLHLCFLAVYRSWNCFFFCVFRVNEFNTKEFKGQVEKAKTCRELIEVLKVSVSLVDFTVIFFCKYCARIKIT